VKSALSIDNDQYRQLFIEEAKEHIETITKSMLILEKEPENQEVVNALFRSAHTLKGSSGMMGFKDFQELTHAMEDVFDDMRKGNHASSNLISVLLNCVDALSQRLDNIQNKVEGEIEVGQLKSKLQSIKTQLQTPEPEKKKEVKPSATENKTIELNQNEKDMVKQAEATGEQCFIIDLKFSDDCGFKSIRASMVLDKIAEVAKVVKTVPGYEDLDEQKLSQGFKMAVTSKFDEKTIEQCAQQVLEVEHVNVASFNASVPSVKDTPVSTPAENNYTETIENKKVVKVQTDPQATQSVRVKFDQLDKLMNWVGELVINKIALLQVTADSRNDSLKRITENIDRLTADLQDLVMEVRMVPVSQVFDRFPRLVRDLSLKKGKKIELVMEGREIEVDRTVLDEIGEPLIHLLRNSVDHGVEMPEDRAKSSKSETGKITLLAQRNGNQVIIEVLDDGAGIDPEKIKESAFKKGFASQAELDKMSKEQLINLIYLPGLSTAKEVNETSGRGVGMDVVKTKIVALGGTVQVESQIGKGTKTIIKLPITLAIIQAILVKDTTQTFAIPTSQVSEIVRVKKGDVKSLGKTNAIIVRDRVIPMVHLHQLLGLPDSNEDEFELLITYFGDENTKVGLVVDSVMRQQDILVKSLNETFAKIKGISGATILGDGQVVLVLDVGQFVSKLLKKPISIES
jgi:two-component system chemotaxis sensor kinase CheA